jgi:hypothetical protein
MHRAVAFSGWRANCPELPLTVIRAKRGLPESDPRSGLQGVAAIVRGWVTSPQR